MAKKKHKKPGADIPEDMRLDPAQRLCARFDSLSIAKFPVADREEMGMRVRDNCAEENIQ